MYELSPWVAESEMQEMYDVVVRNVCNVVVQEIYDREFEEAGLIFPPEILPPSLQRQLRRSSERRRPPPPVPKAQFIAAWYRAKAKAKAAAGKDDKGQDPGSDDLGEKNQGGQRGQGGVAASSKGNGDEGHGQGRGSDSLGENSQDGQGDESEGNRRGLKRQLQQSKSNSSSNSDSGSSSSKRLKDGPTTTS